MGVLLLPEYMISGAKQLAGSSELLEQRVLLINDFDLNNCVESKGVEYIEEEMHDMHVIFQSSSLKSTPCLAYTKPTGTGYSLLKLLLLLWNCA